MFKVSFRSSGQVLDHSRASVSRAHEGLEQNYNKWDVGYTKFYSMRQAQFCLLNSLAGNSVLTNQPLVGPSGQVYSY